MASRPKELALITLSSDFGSQDPYVASMKGVILSRCPDARIHDLSHEIPPQDIPAAGLYIAEAAPWFPRGTIHTVVVDPGVGSNRLPIILLADGQYYIGPDNGLFSLVAERSKVEEIRVINNADWMQPTVSATFHGRDVFATAAAMLARGDSMSLCGPRLDHIQTFNWARPKMVENRVVGQVITVDRFGNLISNIHQSDLHGKIIRAVDCAGQHITGHWRTYSDAPPGGTLYLFSSGSYVELAVRDGSAAETYGIRRGAPFIVELAD